MPRLRDVDDAERSLTVLPETPGLSFVALFALLGVLTLSLLSMLQKILLEIDPFTPIGYVVPIGIGAVSGLGLGIVIRRIRRRQRADQLQWREAIRRSQDQESKFRLLAENARDTIFRWSLVDNSYDYVSPAVQTLTGYPVEDFLVRSDKLFEILHPEDRETLLAMQHRIGERAIPSSIRYRLYHRDGSLVYVHQRHVVVADDDGVPQMLEGIVTDVTAERLALEESRHLTEQLRQTQKVEAIGRLAGGVAHDFNNLLTVIAGNCELALEDLDPGTPLREQIETVLSAAGSAAELTSQLLAFSRKQDLQPVVVTPGPLLQESSHILLQLLGEDVEVVFEAGDPLPDVLIDPRQLQQVLLNLAINARDAMPDGGRLHIRAESLDRRNAYCNRCGLAIDGEYLQIKVSDEGLGIPDEIVESIFDPFFTTKEPGKGTGLGLSTVYGVVHQHGGHVQVESEPGKGTTFLVLLPVADATEVAEVAKPTAPASGARDLQGCERILLVEDEPQVRKLATRYLERFGYRVEAVASGSEAQYLWKESGAGFDLLLTDIVMPGINGQRLAEFLCGQKPELRVVMMSGFADDALDMARLQACGYGFIQKPFGREALGRMIRQVLDCEATR